MATRRYSFGPGENLENVAEAVGVATVTKAIEITVDTANTIVNTATGTRAMTRDEVLTALKVAEEYIARSNWPPS